MAKQYNTSVMYMSDGKHAAWHIPFPFLKPSDIGVRIITEDGLETDKEPTKDFTVYWDFLVCVVPPKNRILIWLKPSLDEVMLALKENPTRAVPKDDFYTSAEDGTFLNSVVIPKRSRARDIIMNGEPSECRNVDPFLPSLPVPPQGPHMYQYPTPVPQKNYDEQVMQNRLAAYAAYQNYRHWIENMPPYPPYYMPPCPPVERPHQVHPFNQFLPQGYPPVPPPCAPVPPPPPPADPMVDVLRTYDETYRKCQELDRYYRNLYNPSVKPTTTEPECKCSCGGSGNVDLDVLSVYRDSFKDEMGRP